VYYELLPQGETIDSKKYCLQLGRLKRAIMDKRPKLANRENVVFHQCTTIHIFSDATKITHIWLGHYASSAILARHCSFGLLFVLVLTESILMDKNSILWRLSKMRWMNFSLRNPGASTPAGLCACQKDGKRSLIKMVNNRLNIIY